MWRALTDHEEFGQWFRARLDGPFKVGEVSRGRITYPGYEHLQVGGDGAGHGAREPVLVHLVPLFGRSGCRTTPAADDAGGVPARADRRRHPPAHLRVGLRVLPDDARRIDALRMNTQGWDAQAKYIAAHVAG